MSRKHYEALAELVHGVTTPVDRPTLAVLLADYLANENPRFDRNRFLAAAIRGDDQ